MVKDVVLGTKFIEALLSLVDQGERDDSARLMGDFERLRGEAERLIASIAAGLSSDTIAPAIRSERRRLPAWRSGYALRYGRSRLCNGAAHQR
jgi:hypothetical protein